MNVYMRRRLLAYVTVFLIFVFSLTMGMTIRQTLVEIRQKEATNLLYFYSENIMLQLQGTLNEAVTLAQTTHAVNNENNTWFKEAANTLLEREEVRYVCLFENDTMVSALPEESYGNQVGYDLKDFSYIYTLAKVVKDLVIEGPIILEGSAEQQEVFLFLQPIVEHDAYLGEVAVALDSEYVLKQFHFDYLSEQGYDYELWRVDPQDGKKEVIAISQNGLDFSHGVTIDFYIPTQWNLSLQPKLGWLSPIHSVIIIGICFVTAFLLSVLVCLLNKVFIYRQQTKKISLVDDKTGLYSRIGFEAALDQWFKENRQPIILFYFVFEGYNQISQLIGPVAESAFLKSVPQHLNDYVQSPFMVGRLGEGNFMLAVCEDMDITQQEDFAKGLAIELILKLHLHGEKRFLTAQYEYMRCEQGKEQAEQVINALIQAYYVRQSEESPARMLTEKCRQLIKGESDVVFEEYTDLEMMELSKTFNQYRKQVEQLAYFDPVFNVGNRPKYLRDANMLISYDKKRKFNLFCVDICDFSQYNQLFSVDIGDLILHEVVYRLSRIFGMHLYRINGDVFLGISLSNETGESLCSRLESLLTAPVFVNNTAFSLQIRITVCQYPANGDAPQILLDRIQSAMRYAKEAEQKIVFYNDKLDDIIKTETDILHQLKAAIQDNTLEIWYQPIAHVKSGNFTSVEALIRLPDGKGGYFSAGQVIALAERSGMVEALGDYVLHLACQFMQSHGEKLGLQHMCVNLSVQQLLTGKSAEHLLGIIHATGVRPDQITLEITESILIQSIERATVTLETMRKEGIRISLDDFGVGYSSLNYLSNLPVDVVKIDRSLTKQIRLNPKQRALLYSIVEVAKINALMVVVEGVETEEDRTLIAASGVQYIQGFYYAKPMPKDKLIQFLSK